MPAETIERLYAAMDAHDGETMAACYADDAAFEDPAFGELRDGRVKDMWRMLCARATDLAVDLREHDDQSARWIATSRSAPAAGSSTTSRRASCSVRTV